MVEIPFCFVYCSDTRHVATTALIQLTLFYIRFVLYLTPLRWRSRKQPPRSLYQPPPPPPTDSTAALTTASAVVPVPVEAESDANGDVRWTHFLILKSPVYLTRHHRTAQVHLVQPPTDWVRECAAQDRSTAVGTGTGRQPNGVKTRRSVVLPDVLLLYYLPNWCLLIRRVRQSRKYFFVMSCYALLLVINGLMHWTVRVWSAVAITLPIAFFGTVELLHLHATLFQVLIRRFEFLYLTLQLILITVADVVGTYEKYSDDPDSPINTYFRYVVASGGSTLTRELT